MVCVCITLFELIEQNTTDWVAYKQHKYIYHSSGGLKSKVRVLAWLGPVKVLFQVADCQLFSVPSRGRRNEGFL